MAAHVEWVDDPGRFEMLAEPWDALAEQGRSPFLRHAWFSAVWSAFGVGRRLAVCALWDGDDLAAAFPLLRTGRRLHALADRDHTPVFHPLARDADALRRLLEAVVDARSSELVACALPVGDASTEALVGASREAGRLTLVEQQHVSPLVDTTGDLASYRHAIDRRRRKDVERRRRRLDEVHGARVTIGEAGELERDLAAAFALEERGWKGRRGTAIAQAAETRAFYEGVARRFHAEGRLRLARLFAGHRLLAFDLCLLDHGRLWTLKGAYDEEFGRFAPGLCLTLAEVEWCFDHGLDALELLGDDEPWKQTFSTGERRHCLVGSYRRRPAPTARFAYRRAVRVALRRAYRTVRPLGRAPRR